ncbi:KAT8 regulatory NSL complex subunit 1-like protein isoform X2 [Eleginops maclovinus]|uniref:KAT8 regulatory NSL complex subunit 1-like protein isoform X2 n=1 Tax=Eleginops maclovinus TaxID=56733 RepID=UPI00308027E9
MAPALTKTLKEGHGIHLSSPPTSVRMDSDGRVMCNTELESHMALTDDGDLQKMWLNLSLFPSLDLCLPVSPLEFPANPVLSPCLQASSRQCETVLLPSPASLLSLLSFPKGLRDSHQVACVFPGVPDMFLVPEHNSQEACQLHGHSAAPECGPGGDDVQHSPFIPSVPPSYCHGEIVSHGYTPYFALQPTLSQGKVTPMGCRSASSVQPYNCRVNSDQVTPRVVKEQLCRQAGLQSRAQRLQRRLQALLGEHALLHCDQQLEGLKKQCQISDVSLDSSDSIHSSILPPQVESDAYCSWLETSTASFSFSELGEFSCSSQALLRGLQEALDSEATASSSSDEEGEKVRIHTKKKTSPVSSSSNSSCERRWLEQRAELGSRWSWLQLRLAELEGRTQQLVELHKHIRSCKGGVVLAESQPLTDRQIQQTLLRELAGLSRTAGSDADNEPCSPTRLLYNIERQSAQLSQIVNSLMPPLSYSPLSKQTPHTWKGKTAFTSGQREGDIFVPGRSKKKRLGNRRLFKSNVSCVCARTRPLVTYHKPKLFAFTICNSSSAQDSGRSTYTHSSSVSSPSCSCHSSCDPVVLCSDPDCSSSRVLSSQTPSSNPYTAVSLSFGTPQYNQSNRAQAREEWSLRPLIINAEPSNLSLYNRCSSTPMHNSHKYKQRARHHKSRVMGLSPIRMAGSAQSQHRKANQRKRKRKHIHRLLEDEKDDLYQLCDLDSSDEVLDDCYTQMPHKQASRGCVRRRQGESVYNINNIVIPMSLAKVEKLQYKDILTPSWRVVDTLSLTSESEKEEDKEEGQEEDNNNKIVAQRHQELEQREKLRWPSWAKRKCCRLPKSRLSCSGGGMCTSGEEGSAELSCAQLLDTDEQQSPEEWLPQTPWESRVFPLEKDEEDTLLLDNPEEVPTEWSECYSTPTLSKNSNSLLSHASCSGATLPSGEQSQSR